MKRDSLKRCRHCGATIEDRTFAYCPRCGGLLLAPERRGVNPASYIKTMGNMAYGLADIGIPQWRTLGRDFVDEAEELYRCNECITMQRVFVEVANSCIGTDYAIERFLQSVGYAVVGEFDEKIYPLMTIEERERRWDIQHPIDESYYDDGAYYHQGYWDDEMECYDAVDGDDGDSDNSLTYECDWILDGDVLLKGYVKNDVDRRRINLRVPGREWDSLAEKFAEELPVDSKIVFSSSDFVNGSWSDREWRDSDKSKEWIENIISVDKVRSFEVGKDSERRIRLLTRKEMFAIRMKELELERKERKPIRV